VRQASRASGVLGPERRLVRKGVPGAPVAGRLHRHGAGRGSPRCLTTARRRGGVCWIFYLGGGFFSTPHPRATGDRRVWWIFYTYWFFDHTRPQAPRLTEPLPHQPKFVPPEGSWPGSREGSGSVPPAAEDRGRHASRAGIGVGPQCRGSGSVRRRGSGSGRPARRIGVGAAPRIGGPAAPRGGSGSGAAPRIGVDPGAEDRDSGCVPAEDRGRDGSRAARETGGPRAWTWVCAPAPAGVPVLPWTGRRRGGTQVLPAAGRWTGVRQTWARGGTAPSRRARTDRASRRWCGCRLPGAPAGGASAGPAAVASPSVANSRAASTAPRTRALRGERRLCRLVVSEGNMCSAE
jgi:hypothetical protein